MFFCKRYLLLLLVPLASLSFERMSTKGLKDAFKKEKKVCPRLKFSNELPKISQADDRILDVVAKSDGVGFWDRFEFFKNKKDKEKNVRYLEYKDFDSYTVPELIERKEYLLGVGNQEDAIKYLKKLITVAENQDEIKKFRFELSNLYLDLKRFKKAVDGFSEYVIYYPGDKHAEYAAYSEILCLDVLRNDASRDQSFTKNLISKAKTFLANDGYKRYVKFVNIIFDDALEDLYNSEVLKFDFYARRKKIKSLENILSSIEKEILAHTTKFNKDYLELKKDLEFIKDGKDYVPRSVRPKIEKLPQYKKPKSFKSRF